MSLRRFVFVVASVAGLMLAGVDLAQAQFGGATGGVFGGRGMPRGDRSMGGGERSADRGPARDSFQPDPASYEMIDYRLSLLEDDLKLTPPQQSLWRAFAEKSLAYASDLARERTRALRAQQAPGVSAAIGLQHVAQAVDAARNRLTALEEVEGTARALYATLTPEQRTLADRRLPTFIAPVPVALPRDRGDGLPGLSGETRGR